MARPKTHKDLSVSILAGSEETFDFFCQPCSPEKHVEAVGYCQQCSEYLCDTCCSYHGKFAAFKQHKVLDQSSMPKTKPQITSRSQDVLMETCKDHPDKILEYYCNGHGKLCCSVCATLVHTSCSDKKYIPDISGGGADSQECKTLKDQLDALAADVSKQLKFTNDQVQANDRCLSDAIDEIKRFRKHINELLDKIEEDIRNLVSKLHQKNSEITKKNLKQYNQVLSDVRRMSAEIDANEKAGNTNKLFVQMKLYTDSKKEVQRQVNNLLLFRIKQFTFRPDEALRQIESKLSSLWSLAMKQGDTPTRARYVREVCVKSEDDTEDCYLGGITLFSGGRAVVTDYVNKAVKLIDINMNKILSRLSMSSEPLDVTYMSPTKVAVLLLNENNINVVSVSQGLSLSKVIETPYAIAGLCYDGSNFIAACQQPGSVRIIDMSGTTLSLFTTDIQGQPLFNEPRDIALGRDKEVVYVTDLKANTMTCMTTGGLVIGVYTHDTLQYPAGVAVGRDGSVYVGSRETHTVFQLSATCDLMRIILSEDQRLASSPYTMSCDEEGDMLCISSSSTAPEECNYFRQYWLE